MLCFVILVQDRRVRLYDCNNKWALRKDVTTRMTRWTITGDNPATDCRTQYYAMTAYGTHSRSSMYSCGEALHLADKQKLVTICACSQALQSMC